VQKKQSSKSVGLSLPRPSHLRGLIRSFAAVIVLCGCLASFAPAFGTDSAGTATTCQRINNLKIINLINAYRARKGLSVLRQDSRLGTSTGFKINDMIRLSYFSHTNPVGRPFYDNVKRARYDYRAVAEVLAKGCRNEGQVFDLWAKSRAHNEALLDPSFLDINCSSSYYRGRTYVACHLARPKKSPMTIEH
jgi:uncharacterized protein YkwD